MHEHEYYTKTASEFLKDANATCNIEFGGISKNQTWKDNEKRKWYDVTISTPNGNMNFVFWDSIYNTEMYLITLEQYVEKKFGYRFEDTTYLEQVKASKELDKLKKENPTAYDILSCLTKYDPGSFEDFCFEYGYDDDSISALQIYLGVVKEYHDLKRIFTDEQMERLRDIN